MNRNELTRLNFANHDYMNSGEQLNRINISQVTSKVQITILADYSFSTKSMHITAARISSRNGWPAGTSELICKI